MPTVATVSLKQGRAKPLWFGHPWVYSEAIDKADTFAPGDEVRVVDHDGRLIGRGFANPRSQLAVRLCTWRDEALDDAVIDGRLGLARGLRVRLGLPSRGAGDGTTAYRPGDSEGD